MLLRSIICWSPLAFLFAPSPVRVFTCMGTHNETSTVPRRSLPCRFHGKLEVPQATAFEAT
ncbi:uncharacterized protein C8R40DRAFT_1135050 [Lentinula edodes]|uniref:uncharacterized protein n=1 Tax=Lentinula edodes TaxID=5353 RepID=UPI001E8CECFD|nr:uncharacterized protein C8R40DRAFT_1135050 [Lentinula edodes]KAH7868355.1 hypothetical protein C8R40DRAFT_1135050 [Lentinula edodes]